eukprot:1811576-Amphidinium_carterae.1
MRFMRSFGCLSIRLGSALPIQAKNGFDQADGLVVVPNCRRWLAEVTVSPRPVDPTTDEVYYFS